MIRRLAIALGRSCGLSREPGCIRLDRVEQLGRRRKALRKTRPGR